MDEYPGVSVYICHGFFNVNKIEAGIVSLEVKGTEHF